MMKDGPNVSCTTDIKQLFKTKDNMNEEKEQIGEQSTVNPEWIRLQILEEERLKREFDRQEEAFKKQDQYSKEALKLECISHAKMFDQGTVDKLIEHAEEIYKFITKK